MKLFDYKCIHCGLEVKPRDGDRPKDWSQITMTRMRGRARFAYAPMCLCPKCDELVFRTGEENWLQRAGMHPIKLIEVKQEETGQ